MARHAGEFISEVTPAMVTKKGLKAIAQVIHPYPTQAESIKKRLMLTIAKPFLTQQPSFC